MAYSLLKKKAVKIYALVKLYFFIGLTLPVSI